MLVELRPLDSIKPYDKNPRHNDAAVDAVARSIEQYGFRQPVVVDKDGVIIVGHTRWKAAKKMNLAQVPVHVADLPPEKARAYRIADNATAAIATWDDDLLPEELRDLAALDIDIKALGFSPEELAEWLAPAETALEGADDAVEPAKVAVSRTGDLWILGNHRLLCGDSTKRDDVLRVMDGQKAALVATDPPYLVEYTGERPDRDGGNSGGKDWSATYHEVEIKDADGFFRGVFTNVALVLGAHAPTYCWHAHKRQATIDRIWDEVGILNHQQIIWVKPVAVFGRMFWHQRHEPCLMGWAKGSRPDYDRDQGLEHSTVWEVDWAGKSRIIGNEHPTQKPVELFARPMRRHTKAGDVCFEPFSGSGSQIIAAEQLGRRCYAIEIEPVFVDAAIRRWQKATGKEATLDATGRTWAATAAERGVDVASGADSETAPASAEAGGNG